MRSDVRETVLEHEIGHALGFDHIDFYGNHIMHSDYDKISYNFKGMPIN